MARNWRNTSEAVGAAEVKNAEVKEAVVCTLAGVVTTPDVPQVLLNAHVPIKTAAESTKQTIRIRRAGVAGHEVAKVVVTTTGVVEDEIELQCQDEPGELAGGTYVVTIEPAVAKEVTALAASLRASF